MVATIFSNILATTETTVIGIVISNIRSPSFMNQHNVKLLPIKQHQYKEIQYSMVLMKVRSELADQ